MITQFVLADPVSLTAIGLGITALTGAAGVATSLINKPKAPAAPNVPAPTPPASNPQGTPGSAVPQQSPSFLAAATTPQQGSTIGGGSGKSLLGQ